MNTNTCHGQQVFGPSQYAQDSFAQLLQLARVMTKSRPLRIAHAVTAWAGMWVGRGGALDFCTNVVNPMEQVCKVGDSPFVFIHADDDMGEVV